MALPFNPLAAMRRRQIAGMIRRGPGQPHTGARPGATIGRQVSGLARSILGGHEGQHKAPEFSHAFREHFMTRSDPKAARQAARLDAVAREDPVQRARRAALAQGMGEVQEVLDKNLANRRAQIVNPKTPAEAQKIQTGLREINEIQALFLEALRTGQIRNLQDERQLMPQFYTYLKRRIEGLKQNPEFAMSNPKSAEYYARLSLARFYRFTPQEAANLRRAMAGYAEARWENYLSLNE